MKRSYTEYKNFKDLEEGKYPSEVYKFRCFDDEDDNILRILTNQEVYFSTRKELDSDYPEGYLPFDFEAVTKEDLKKFTDMVVREQFPFKNPAQRVVLRDKMLKKHLQFYSEDNRKEVFENWVAFLDNNYAFYSFSHGCENIEMWEKFGCMFTGYCIEFDTREFVLGLGIKPVSGPIHYYDDKSTPMVKPISTSKEEVVQKSLTELFSVPDRYDYEDEFRVVITSTQSIFHGKPLGEQDRAFKVPKEAFKSIIVGYEIEESDLTKLRLVVQEHLPHVELKKAIFDDESESVVVE